MEGAIFIRCNNCGQDCPDYMQVCPICGTQLKNDQMQYEIREERQVPQMEDTQQQNYGTPPYNTQPNMNQQYNPNGIDPRNQQSPAPQKKTNMGIIITAMVCLGLVIVIGAGCTFYFIIKAGKETNQVEIAEIAETSFPKNTLSPQVTPNKSEEDNNRKESSNPAVAEEKQQLDQQIKRYNTSSNPIQSINIYEKKYTPNVRNENRVWDSTLFYTLEEIDQESSKDGKIYLYDVEKKQLRNGTTGNIMEYEIYRDPSTNTVNKIVSIEENGDYLDVTDYYYDNNKKVSFIFQRQEVNYIPSYAIPTKTGERYYFSEDSMVRWRTVIDGEITNRAIGKKESESIESGTKKIYDELQKSEREQYDELEINMLNAAYNTYNIVLNAESISFIEGYAYNQDSQPLSDAQVQLYIEDSDQIIYEGKTDTQGCYKIYVPSQNRKYHIKVTKSGYDPVEIYKIGLDNQLIGAYQENAYLISDNNHIDTNTTLCISDAFTYDTSNNSMLRISDAKIYLRKGINNRNGTILCSGESDQSGEVQVSIDTGMYTLEVQRQGYISTFISVFINSFSPHIDVNISPSLGEDEVRIVLNWGAVPEDLDSHLFTPFDSSSNDTTYHIWYGNMVDGNNNCLDVDDTTSYGPETMTINHLGSGLYKYYVVDFTNSSSANTSSTELSNSGAYVNIYTKDGMVKTFYVPSNKEGVIWELFEIRNKRIIPSGRFYSSLDENKWWDGEK